MNYIEVLQAQLQAMTRGAVAALPSIAIALLVLLATWVVARFASRIAHALTGRTRLRADLKELLETLVKVAVWLVGFLLAATIVIRGFTFGGMIAGLGIGGVAIGFAFKDIFENFLAGVLIMLRDKMQLGDTIACEDVRGKVEHISLRETHIRQPNGELTIVPNSMLFTNPVLIVTDVPVRRDEILLGVSVDCDLALARTAVRDAVASVSAVDTGRPIDVYAQAFDSTAGAVELLVRWWSNAADHDRTAVKSDVVIAIKRALDAAGIDLPSTSTTEVILHERNAA